MRYDPAQLAALEAVLRHGAFDVAAAELNVTPSAVSQRIRALEDRIGSPLVLRGAPARATAIGARLASHARDLALLDAALAQELGQTPAPARLRIILNADSLDTWVIPALTGLDLLFDIEVADESVSADRLREGDAAAAISASARPVQGCDLHPLGQLRYVATCTPAFRDQHFAGGLTPDALGRAPMLDYSQHDQLQRRWLRGISGAALAPPTHYLPSTHGFVAATLAGLGWALNPLPLVQGHLDSGALIVMAEAPQDVALYWHVRSLTAPQLLPLTRALKRQAALMLIP